MDSRRFFQVKFIAKIVFLKSKILQDCVAIFYYVCALGIDSYA